MASLANAAEAAKDLHQLSGRLHAELVEGSGDFTRLVRIADAVGEKGDVLAAAFHEVDHVLSALIRGDGPVAVEPADDGTSSDAATAKPPAGSHGVISELRAILERLSDVERELRDDHARDLGPDAASAAAEDESHHPAGTAGSAAGRRNGGTGASGHAGNGGLVYDRLTRAQLYNWAQEADLPGRSRMSKDELVEALRREA